MWKERIKKRDEDVGMKSKLMPALEEETLEEEEWEKHKPWAWKSATVSVTGKGKKEETEMGNSDKTIYCFFPKNW